MIEMHIYLEPTAGKEADLEALYWREYVPGISIQEGFRRTLFLKRRDALREYEIDISFDSEALRQKWAGSPQHQVTWPKVVALCQRIAWAGYDAVEKDG